MVNGPLPGIRHGRTAMPLTLGNRATRTQGVARIFAARRPRFAAFAQILGKLNFFKLGENLQRILVDYAEKRSSTANATFKRAC